MRHRIQILLSILVICSTVFAQIEFDGGYLQTKNGQYIELREVRPYTMTVYDMGLVDDDIFFSGNKNLSILSENKYYYVINSVRQHNVRISQNKFKGIAIKGSYNFEYFSLHPLHEKRIEKGYIPNYTRYGKKVELQKIKRDSNNGPASRNSPFYVPGEKIEVRNKSLGTNSYYWQPRYNLPKGEYVAWIGKSFWIFEIE